MIQFLKAAIATLALLGGVHTHAADAILRVACEADGDGADVTVNGKFKGQCPIDMTVKPGALLLRVEKKMGPDAIGVFEREVRIGDGVVQRVNVALTRKLTDEGRKAAEVRNKERLQAHEIAVAAHQRALLAQQTEVQQCASQMSTAAHARMMDCWTNSGGCVGPWPCENSDKRMQRCSSNGKGHFDDEEFMGTCRARVRPVSAPVPPRLESD